MERKTKLGIVAIVLVLLALLMFKFGKDYILPMFQQKPCTPLTLDYDEDGNYIPPSNMTCVDGVWVPKYPPDSYSATFCENEYTLTTITWNGMVWSVSREYAQGEEYCLGDQMFTVPYSCGGPSYTCESNENPQNCWVDCGPIQDWGEFHSAVEANPGLYTYLESEYEFQWDNAVILDAVEEIEVAYAPQNPFEFVKAAVAYLDYEMSYDITGVEQCGESAATSLERGVGNCVDYSVGLISILRAVGIPAKQTVGCVSNYNWRCTPFESLQFELELTGVQGHSWVEVWVGEERGWVQADPTTGVSLARSCVGYYKIEDTDSNNLCWISDPEHLDFCETF